MKGYFEMSGVFGLFSVGVDRLIMLGEKMLFFAGEGFGFLFSPLGDSNPFNFYMGDNSVSDDSVFSWVGRGIELLIEIVSLGLL